MISSDAQRFGGQGIDSINVICTKSSPTVQIPIPTSDELLEEILVERGIRTAKDETRTRYIPAIDMFGGLLKTADAFSGIPLRIIQALTRTDPGNVSPTHTFNDIKDSARAGKGNKPTEQPILAIIDSDLPRHAARVGRRRFEAHPVAGSLDIQDIVTRLLERKVLKRLWKLDRCPWCDKQYCLDHINPNLPLSCPGCLRPIQLNYHVVLAYQLNELIALAIAEGIVPVVLTGRFLHNLTSQGFIWLPGVKCSSGTVETDFDIFASCDGHLVAAECKSLEGTRSHSQVWRNEQPKIERAIVIAKSAGVRTFVVASLCGRYPETFQQALGKAAGSDMSVHLLYRTDLTEGHKRIQAKNEPDRFMRIDDFLPASSPRRKGRPRTPGDRRVRFGPRP